MTTASTQGWRAIIGWAKKSAGVPLQFIDHAPPKLLSDLRMRSDLGVVQMCGQPASLEALRKAILLDRIVVLELKEFDETKPRALVVEQPPAWP